MLLRENFGFIKRVDKGEITTVKHLESVLLRGAGFLEFQLNVISKIVILSFGELLETKLIIRGNENLKYLKNETKIYFRV